jgi:hypothetical protein
MYHCDFCDKYGHTEDLYYKKKRNIKTCEKGETEQMLYVY